MGIVEVSSDRHADSSDAAGVFVVAQPEVTVRHFFFSSIMGRMFQFGTLWNKHDSWMAAIGKTKLVGVNDLKS